MDPLKIGTAIKTLRLKVGYTQYELADCLNVTDKAVSKWERGLSVPDISIVTRLSNLLNCDVDNLLEGNITYLDKDWQGILILKQYDDIFAGSEVYGKPLVDIMLGYFMLAGIGDIYISCNGRDRRFIEGRMGDGREYGIRLYYLPEGESKPLSEGNTMVVYGNPFVYGPFLTRCFQRAMSRMDGISVVTVDKPDGGGAPLISYDISKIIRPAECEKTKQYCVPILFFPRKWFGQIGSFHNVMDREPLYAEPLDNGVIEYQIEEKDALMDTAFFFRYLKRSMGRDIYNIGEIAKKRNFIEKEAEIR